MKMKILILKIILVLLLQTGCQTTQQYTARVSSFGAHPNREETRYVIKPSNSDEVNRFEFEEYAGYLERALAVKGFQRENDDTVANVIIYLGYNISGPNRIKTRTYVPIMEMVPTPNTTTTGNINYSNNQINYQESTSGTMIMQTKEFREIIGESTTYVRTVRVYASEMKTDDAAQSINDAMWVTEIVSEGSSGELRNVMPVMIAAALEYFGESSKGVHIINTTENSRNVRYIKGQAESPWPSKNR